MPSIEPGQVVAGRCALQNVGAARVRGVVLALIGEEREVVSRRLNEGEAHRFEARIFEGKPGEGATIPFAAQSPTRRRTGAAPSRD